MSTFNEHVTVIATCFNRPNKAMRLAGSIEQAIPGTNVIIADTSEQEVCKPLEGYLPDNQRFIYVNEKSGNLSYGRNRALECVTTPYFVLVDDDHYFESSEQLLDMYRFIVNPNNNCDIVGGYYKEPKYKRDNRWTGQIYIEQSLLRMRDQQVIKDDHKTPYKTDVIQNFFIANTGKVKRMGGWDEEIAISFEHIDFFLMAKRASLTVYDMPSAYVMHEPGPDDKTDTKTQHLYVAQRKGNGKGFPEIWEKFQQKWGIDRIINSHWVFRSTDPMYKRPANQMVSGHPGSKVIDYTQHHGVIVLTEGRTGSSLVANMLDKLGLFEGTTLGPAIGWQQTAKQGFGENDILTELCMKYGTIQNIDKQQLADDIDDWMHYMMCNVMPGQMWAAKTPHVNKFLNIVDQVIQRRQYNIKYIRPQRSLEAIAKSYCNTPWKKGASVKKLVDSTRIVKDSIDVHTKKSNRELLDLQFEQLISDPHKAIESMVTFLGISPTTGQIAEAVDLVDKNLVTVWEQPATKTPQLNINSSVGVKSQVQREYEKKNNIRPLHKWVHKYNNKRIVSR